jgi:hypothetical protein
LGCLAARSDKGSGTNAKVEGGNGGFSTIGSSCVGAANVRMGVARLMTAHNTIKVKIILERNLLIIRGILSANHFKDQISRKTISNSNILLMLPVHYFFSGTDF